MELRRHCQLCHPADRPVSQHDRGPERICVVPNLLKYSKEACDKIVHELLNRSTLPMTVRPQVPSEMSGGQQQRIGILRASLAASPPSADGRAFSALDP